MTVTPVEFLWREWRLGEGRFRGRGPASKPRPTQFPHRIPAAWWMRLVAFLARRKKAPAAPAHRIPAPFSGQGLMLLEPRGGTENIAAAAIAGFTYLLLNIGHVSGGTWTTHRQRAAALGLAVVPWKRIYGPDDVRLVEETADLWRAPACAHNLEAEAATTFPPRNLASLAGSYGPRVRAVITEPWMQLVDWTPLAGWVAMPEAFLNARSTYLPKDLVGHAHDLGCPMSVPVFGWGQWADAPRDVPPGEYLRVWGGPYAVYAGDGKESRYGEWRR